MKRLDPSKPEDLKQLVATGLIWQPAVPVEYKDMALDALAESRIEPPDNLPAEVLDRVNEMRNGMGMEPITLGSVQDEGEPSA